jgi:uncharacterized protein with NRDE domain
MCTVLIAFQAFTEQPLRIAANRDEQLDRPAEAFAHRPGPPPFLAPRDIVAGGTWIGVNAHGVVVAITNRFGGPGDSQRRSRGELVHLALAQTNVNDAIGAIDSLDPRDYNGFHLTAASTDAATTLWSDGETFQTVVRKPGVYVVTERSFGAAPSAREDWLLASVDDITAPSQLDELLLHESEDGFEGTLVSVPAMNYGTRSSTIIGLGERPTLKHAHGRPDRVPYDDFGAELASLLRC